MIVPGFGKAYDSRDRSPSKDSAMKKNVVVPGCDQRVSRRKILQGGLAAALASAAGTKAPLLANPSTPPVQKKTGARAIDIHAHYFPQTYFDLFNSEGQRFNAE